MSRGAWVLLMLSTAVFAGVWYFAGARSADGRPPAAATAAVAPLGNPAIETAMVPAPLPVDVSADEVTRWIADANGSNAVRRAAAISALARAPRAQALPVLSHLLINGEPGTDRPQALRSLRDLALAQGDADGKVREAIREVIYHGDSLDEVLLADAQASLDAVEQSATR